MTILALEFSSERRSVALARAGGVLSEAAESGGYRVTNAFALIQRVLAATGIARDAIAVIAVGLGPGSYTGIRAAIALAQGWQLAGGVKVLGLGSAAVLAAQAQAEQQFGRVNVVINAQRGEFYLASWELGETQLREISPLKIVAATEIAARQAAGEICVGPEMEPPRFPTAARLAQLALARNDFMAGENLEPIYLRETTFLKAPAPRY